MIEDRFEKALESVEKAQYKLLYDAHRAYYFSSKGNTPLELEGGFSGLRDALIQWDKYNARLLATKEVKRVEIPDECVLEDLTTKIQLLSFAEKHGIEVASGMTNPKQLKKFLKAETTING